MEVIICFNYCKIGINIVSIIISVSIVFSIEKMKNELFNISKDKRIDAYISVKSTEQNSNEMLNNVIYQDENNIETEDEIEWALKIPKIELFASIEEGTNEEVLNRAIGHFEETTKKIGNVGLAAHNRGYKVNYFSRLKELNEGDDIYYIIENKVRKYIVSKILIIYETDWTMLENTEDNRLTLITCVENREKYRLCIQAIEVNN